MRRVTGILLLLSFTTALGLLACGGTARVAPKASPTLVPHSTPKPWPYYTRFPPGSTALVEVVTVEPAGVSASTVEIRRITVVVETIEVGPACECSGHLYNCDDFGSASSAQRCYEWCKQQTGEDVYGLDPDNDGVACDSQE